MLLRKVFPQTHGNQSLFSTFATHFREKLGKLNSLRRFNAEQGKAVTRWAGRLLKWMRLRSSGSADRSHFVGSAATMRRCAEVLAQGGFDQNQVTALTVDNPGRLIEKEFCELPLRGKVIK